MALNRQKHEPVDFTCPLIDAVISFISEVEDILIEVQQLEDNEDLVLDARLIQNRISGISVGNDSALEKIRSANDQLRYWGNEQFDRAESNEKEYDYSERQKKELEQEIFELNSKIEKLKNHIEDLEIEIEELKQLKTA